MALSGLGDKVGIGHGLNLVVLVLEGLSILDDSRILEF